MMGRCVQYDGSVQSGCRDGGREYNTKDYANALEGEAAATEQCITIDAAYKQGIKCALMAPCGSSGGTL